MKRVFLSLVFGSFAIGTYAQCDSLMEIKIDPKMLDIEEVYSGTVEPYDPNNPPPPPDTNEVRRIYFIHGLGGSPSAWSKAAEACQHKMTPSIPGFPARNCEYSLSGYANHTYNLYLATDAVRKEISKDADVDRNKGIINPARSIIIAHSQGGIVTRELMHLDLIEEPNHTTLSQGMNYGGVVTVASPLQGAMILNNRDKILAMANDGCKKVLPSFITGELGAIYNLFSTKLNALMDSVCETAANTALPMLFNDYYKGITNSYTVGASMINTLNQDTNNAAYKAFPKMAFYAVEPQENIFWRTLNWMTSDPNDTGYFEANDDWRLFDSTIKPKMIDKFKEKKESHYAEYLKYKKLTYTGFLCFVFPLAGAASATAHAIRANQEEERYLAYEKGLEWFDNVNESWQTVIGTTKVYAMNPEVGHHTATYTPNDGVVLAESAANLPGATHAPVEIYPNKDSTVDIEKGSSHMQVRNDAGLKEHLNNLFDGKYDKWFKVKKK